MTTVILVGLRHEDGWIRLWFCLRVYSPTLTVQYTCTHTGQTMRTLGAKCAWARYEYLVWICPKLSTPSRLVICQDNNNSSAMDNRNNSCYFCMELRHRLCATAIFTTSPSLLTSSLGVGRTVLAFVKALSTGRQWKESSCQIPNVCKTSQRL